MLVVLARDGHGVVAYHVATGRERWRYRDGDALPQAFHVAADRVSLVLQRGTSSTGERGLVGHLVGDGWCGVRPAGGGTSVACYGPAGQPHGSANLFAEPAGSVATGGDIVLAAQSRRPWVSVLASDDLRAPPVTITGELPDDADRLLVSGGAVVVAGGTGEVAVLVRDA